MARVQFFIICKIAILLTLNFAWGQREPDISGWKKDTLIVKNDLGQSREVIPRIISPEGYPFKHGKAHEYKGELLWRITPYHRGRINGMQQSFFPNGALENKTPYENNSIEGNLLRYDSLGQLLSKTPYLHNERHGVHQGFFDGSLVEVIEYKKNHRDGLYKKWFPDSTRIVCTYKKGQLQGVYSVYKNDSKIAQGFFKKGAKEGLWLEWDPKGFLRKKAHYKRGKLHGSFESWFSKNRKNRVETWVEGQRHGEQLIYDKTGKLVEQAYYESGVCQRGCWP